MGLIFKRCRHPSVSFFYFLGVIFFAVAVRHPLLTAISLICGVLGFLRFRHWDGIKKLLFVLPFFGFLSCLNPLVSRYGTKVLFYVFNNPSWPFYLEALLYGLNTGLSFTAFFVWFELFSFVFTEEKLTYVLGPFFPSLSVMFIMILRFIPFYRKRAVEISEGRKGLGLEQNETFFKRLSARTSLFLAVAGSSLEDGTVTAATMEQRGWGQKVRTSFLQYKFRFSDGLYLAAAIVPGALMTFAVFKGGLAPVFYPAVNFGSFMELSLRSLYLVCSIIFYSLVFWSR